MFTKGEIAMKRILLGFVALIFVVSCAKDGGQGYAVKINGATLSKDDVQAEMKNLPPMAKDFFKGPEGVSRFVDELIKKELLFHEAKKRGFENDKELKRKIEESKKIILINHLLEKEMESAAKPTDKDIKDYYDKHKDEFVAVNQVRLSHIVVKTEDDAKKVYSRLQVGEDFKKVASEVSLDKATAKSGGDMGMFKRGEMKPELEQVAFSLKKGDVSMPIKLQDGIHILKSTDTKGTIVEFEKVKGVITQRVGAERQKESFDKLLENLKKNYKVEINKDVLSKLSFDGVQPPVPAAPQAKPEKK